MGELETTINRADPIEYLMRRKFPEEKGDNFVKDIIRNLSLPSSDHLTRDYNSQELYYLELIKKPKMEIQNLVNHEKLKEEHEKGFFFDRPSAEADFQEWYRMPNWSLEEALALSLGKNPKKVNPDSLDNYSNYNNNFNSTHKSSSLYKEYKLRMETLIRYINSKKISAHPTPLEFINWLQENDFSIPKELEKLVYERWGKPVDLQSQYKQLKIENQKIKETLEIQEKQLTELLKEKQILNNDINRLSQSFSVRERESMVKLIVVMAVSEYKYNPKAQRNKAVSNILQDFKRLGLSLDRTTILKFLHDGIELLPPKPGEY